MEENKITKYIHAIQSGTICNLRCSYCYVPSLADTQRCTPTKFNYPLEQIAKAISKERIGGVALINYVGGGETFLTDESIQLVKLFLEEGHVVNAVSNLTYTPAIDKFCNFPDNLKSRLQFCASFHYMELVKRNLLDTYFENIKKLENAGIQIFCNLVICHEYLPYLEEIKAVSLEKLGRLPYVSFGLDPNNGWKKYDFFTDEFVAKLAEDFDCQHLLLENKYTSGIYRKEFCYMGDWGFVFNLETGNISACFDSPPVQNIVKNITEPIKFEPVGQCCSRYCSCGSTLFCLGYIDTFTMFPVYSELLKKYKKPILSSRVDSLTSNYLWETNKKYTKIGECIIRIRRKLNRKYRIGTWMEK